MNALAGGNQKLSFITVRRLKRGEMDHFSTTTTHH